MNRSDEVMKDIEKIVLENQGVEAITVNTGFTLLTRSNATNAGFAFIKLKDWSEREQTANEIIRH